MDVFHFDANTCILPRGEGKCFAPRVGMSSCRGINGVSFCAINRLIYHLNLWEKIDYQGVPQYPIFYHSFKWIKIDSRFTVARNQFLNEDSSRNSFDLAYRRLVFRCCRFPPWHRLILLHSFEISFYSFSHMKTDEFLCPVYAGSKIFGRVEKSPANEHQRRINFDWSDSGPVLFGSGEA